MKTKLFILIFCTFFLFCCTRNIDEINFDSAIELMLDHSFNVDPLIPYPPPSPPGYKLDFDTSKIVKHFLPFILNNRLSDFGINSYKDSLFVWANQLCKDFKYAKLDLLLKIDSINMHKVICLPIDRYNLVHPQEFVNLQRINKAYGIVWVSNPYIYKKYKNKYFIFYLRYSCGPLCYKERAYYLEYKNRKFKILKFKPLFSNKVL